MLTAEQFNAKYRGRFAVAYGAWISVEKRQPPKGLLVLVWHRVFGPIRANLKSDGSFWDTHGNCLTLANPINWWMPMPWPPPDETLESLSYRDSLYFEEP